MTASFPLKTWFSEGVRYKLERPIHPILPSESAFTFTYFHPEVLHFGMFVQQ